MSGSMEFLCKGCGVRLDGKFVFLARNIEHTEAVDETKVITEVTDSEEVGTWCLKCGAVAALAALADLGVDPVPTEADPPDRPCARCRSVVVPNAQPHRAYVVTVDRLVGNSISTEELLVVSPICAACDAQLAASGSRASAAGGLQ